MEHRPDDTTALLYAIADDADGAALGDDPATAVLHDAARVLDAIGMPGLAVRASRTAHLIDRLLEDAARHGPSSRSRTA